MLGAMPTKTGKAKAKRNRKSATQRREDEGLLAGTGSKDISPRKPMFLCGFPHVDRISTGIHDQLWASALCLRNGSQAVLLVAVDNLFVNPPVALRWRKAVGRATGIQETGVFISTSHTHSGPHTADVLEWGPSPVVPPVDPEYLQLMQDGIVAASVDAARGLRPAELAWTSARIDGVGGNRHDPVHGARDPEVGTLVVRERKSRRLLAISVTYCMHPTVLHEDSKLVSSDFPHYTRVHLREHLGESLTVLYHTGPAGNQSPRHDVRSQTFAEAERLGRLLGAAILRAVRTVPDTAFSASPVLAGMIKSVHLPLRVLPDVTTAKRLVSAYRRVFAQLKKQNAPRADVRTAECDVFGAEETLFLAECDASGLFRKVMADYDPMDVQVVRIGEACLAGFPGELFVEYDLMTKWLAPRRVFCVNLVNGEVQGYIVTEAALREGRYETNNRAFAPSAGGILVDAAIRLIARMS